MPSRRRPIRLGDANSHGGLAILQSRRPSRPASSGVKAGPPGPPHFPARIRTRWLFAALVLATTAALSFSASDHVGSAQQAIEAGSEVLVQGAEGCASAYYDYFDAGSDVPPLDCLPNGTRARVDQEAAPFSGSWWRLLGYGWVEGRFLTAISPPEPDLAPFSGDKPFVPGVIAYVADDGNVWLSYSDGISGTPITSDGTPITADGRINYEDLLWSPDGRFLVFSRTDIGAARASRDPTYDATSIVLYDAAANELIPLDDPPGRHQYALGWFDSDHLWVVDARDDFHGCFGDTYATQSIQSVDVLMDEREQVLPASSDSRFIVGIGPWSSDGKYVLYRENSYCEGPGFPCVLELSSLRGHCVDDGTWSVERWLGNEEALLVDSPYGNPAQVDPLAWNVRTDEMRPATEVEASSMSAQTGPGGGQLTFSSDSSARLFHFNGKAVLSIPAQQFALYGDESLAPNDDAFVFTLYSGNDYELWVGLTDASQKAWLLARTAGEAAWQPKMLDPVLFVHGCGGALGTWTDPGWITDTQKVADIEIGSTSGRLHRGMIPGLPALPAYALDYGGSSGTVFALAGLLPRSIDKILEETGSEEVMLVTHSMGGVLAQAYAAGLALGDPFDDDVAASFMVAPPSRGAFVSNWLTGQLGDALACPQASELGPNSETMARLRAASLPQIDYAVVSGTRFWLPFVGLNDGIVADADVGLSGVAYNKRQVRGIHADVHLLPNTIGALCSTVLNDPCTPELWMEEVRDLFHERYVKDMFE